MCAGAHPRHPERAGDLTFTWIRWAQVSGEGRDLVDVPLNEASKAYELDVLDGTGQLVRTLSAAATSVVCSATAQTTDFGASTARSTLQSARSALHNWSIRRRNACASSRPMARKRNVSPGRDWASFQNAAEGTV